MVKLCKDPEVQSEIRDMLAAGRFNELAAMAAARIGCPVDPVSLRLQCEQVKEVGHVRWTDSTYRHWLLCRAVEVATQRWLESTAADIRFTCELHVFAINFLETEEQLARLRNEEIEEAKYARSKLTKKQSRKVRPVNQVAQNVAPFPAMEEGGAE